MQYKRVKLPGILRNRAFDTFLASQSISCIGDAFQLVAVATLLMEVTGSGMAVGFGILCAPLPSIFLSLFAGIAGDRLNKKLMLVLIDLLRGIVAAMFIFVRNVWSIYALLLLLSSLDVFYSPPRNRFIAETLDKGQLVAGNSVLGGGYGLAYLIGPLAAGFLVEARGPEIAFAINCASFFISAFLLLNIRQRSYLKASRSPAKRYGSTLLRDVRDGMGRLRNTPALRDCILTMAAVSLCTTAVNTAFYPFAFDMLGITSKMWGLMLSILYGANLLAMLISIAAKRRITRITMVTVHLILLLVAGIWYSYGMINKYAHVLLLQLVEGTLLSLCSIFLNSRMQMNAGQGYVARVAGINDIMNSLGKLVGAGGTFMLLGSHSVKFVFTASSFLIFFINAYKLLTGEKEKTGL